MSERNKYTPETISRIAESIAAEPAPERPMSKLEALAALGPQLKAAHDRGHSLRDLVDLLAAQGLETHQRAVARVLRDLEASGGASKRARKTRKSSTPAGGEDAQLRANLEAAGQQRLAA